MHLLHFLQILHMPTLGAHFTDDFSAIIEGVAATSPEKKVGPWITEACRQRLEREGLLPNNPRAEVLAAIEEIGVDRAIEVLRKAIRRKDGKAA
jgi:hypothetical protein